MSCGPIFSFCPAISPFWLVTTFSPATVTSELFLSLLLDLSSDDDDDDDDLMSSLGTDMGGFFPNYSSVAVAQVDTESSANHLEVTNVSLCFSDHPQS